MYLPGISSQLLSCFIVSAQLASAWVVCFGIGTPCSLGSSPKPHRSCAYQAAPISFCLSGNPIGEQGCELGWMQGVELGCAIWTCGMRPFLEV